MAESPAPFVRFSRDKRGYESVYLVHVSGRPARPRVLYWFRSPPGVKLGRSPFDENVRKALEEQYPELRFDWKRISEAQPPPVSEGEVWRERRRAERSAKQARQAAVRERIEVGVDVTDSEGTVAPEDSVNEVDPIDNVESVDAPDGPGDIGLATSRAGAPVDRDLPAEVLALDLESAPESLLDDEEDDDGNAAAPLLDQGGPVVEPGPAPQAAGEVVPGVRRRRRRRRRGRGRHGQVPAGPPGAARPQPLETDSGPQSPAPEVPGPDPEIRADAPSRDDEPAS